MRTVVPVARAIATGSANWLGRSPAARSRAGVGRERPLIVRQCRTIGVNQAMRVEHDHRRGGRARVHSLGHQFPLQEGGDADGRPSRAEEHEAIRREATSLPACGEQAREDDRTGALDVVVEARLPVAIAIEDADRVVLLEVLPLDDGPREDPGHSVDERLDDRVVRPAAQPRRPVPDVERIVQERLTVGPDIERDGQGAGRIDARGGRVQRQLAHRDRHPAGPLVAEAQDALVVGDDDQADVIAGGSKDGVDPVDVIRSDPDAARASDDVAELLASKTDGRRVDDRQELLEVLDEEPVEERLVAVLECCQSDVPLEVIGLAADVLELQPDLLVDRRQAWRQQTVQAKGVALADRECGALVQERIRDQIVPAAPNGQSRGRSLTHGLRGGRRRGGCQPHRLAGSGSDGCGWMGGVRSANRCAARSAWLMTPTKAPLPSTTGRPVTRVERSAMSASSMVASTATTVTLMVITSATSFRSLPMSHSTNLNAILPPAS